MFSSRRQLMSWPAEAAVCLPVLIVCLLAGCAGAEQAASNAQPVLEQGPAHSETLRVVTLLQQGQEAYTAAPSRLSDLAQVLRSLDLLGARANDPSENPASAWRAAADTELRLLPVYRGRLRGPAYQAITLEAQQGFSTKQVFAAGKTASVAAASSSAAITPNLEVKTDAGETICTNNSRVKNSCEWVPLFTERYTIELRHDGASKANLFLSIK